MNRSRLEFVICLLLLLAVFGLSLFLRISLPWSEVFGSGTVKLTDNDAYFYVRLLDNLCAHFPALGSFDPYYAITAVKDLSGQPLFFVYFMGFLAWLIGGGAPTHQIVDLVAVYTPAVLGALMVFPVFFLGRAIVNKWTGLAAALVITLLPGEYLVRTLLGNADSHVLEIFLTTLFMLFMLAGLNKGLKLSLPIFQRSNRQLLVSVFLYAVLAGITLGLYTATWSGAILFVIISLASLVINSVSDHLRGRQAVYPGMVGISAYGTALLIGLCAGVGLFTYISLAVSAVLCLLLSAVSLLLNRRGINPINFLYITAGMALIAGVILLAIMPQQFINLIKSVLIQHSGDSIAETQPLVIQDGKFTLALFWGNYTAASLLALAALVIVVYRSVKEGHPGMLMLAVWTLAVLIITLAMRRFAYYLAVDVAILSGISCWLILRACGFTGDRNTSRPLIKPGKDAGRKRPRSRAVSPTWRTGPAMMVLGTAVVLVLIVYPSTGPLPGGDRPFADVATRALFAPSDGWCDALKWLRENAAEPFGDADYYYENYRGRPRQADYSVLTWWDYGYWVTRIGHRVPVCNPGYSLQGEEKFFTEQDPVRAAALSTKWKARYVLVDDYMVNWRNGFKAIAYAAGIDYSKYYEIYYRRQGETLTQALLYHPAYYETMAVRLFCFEGKKYVPSETAVISWEPAAGPGGGFYKLITDLKMFRTYADAGGFVAAQRTGNWQIVGKDPLVSPVPLEALEGYKLVYISGRKDLTGPVDRKVVKVFEYTAVAGQHE